MASEICAPGRTGYTHYARVLDYQGRVWNGSALAALASVAWTASVVTLTEVGATGEHLGSLPALAEGVYQVRVYERQGGTAAATDPLVFETTVEWSGTVVTGVPDLPSAAEVATQVLDTSTIATGWSVRRALKAVGAMLAGKISGVGGGGNVTIRSVDDSVDALVVTPDSAGNRTAVTVNV